MQNKERREGYFESAQTFYFQAHLFQRHMHHNLRVTYARTTDECRFPAVILAVVLSKRQIERRVIADVDLCPCPPRNLHEAHCSSAFIYEIRETIALGQIYASKLCHETVCRYVRLHGAGTIAMFSTR